MDLRGALEGLAQMQSFGQQGGQGGITIADIMRMVSEGGDRGMQQAQLGLQQQQEQRLQRGQEQQYGLGLAGLGAEQERLAVSQAEQGLREAEAVGARTLTPNQFHTAVAAWFEAFITARPDLSPDEARAHAVEYVQKTEQERAGTGPKPPGPILGPPGLAKTDMVQQLIRVGQANPRQAEAWKQAGTQPPYIGSRAPQKRRPKRRVGQWPFVPFGIPPVR